MMYSVEAEELLMVKRLFIHILLSKNLTEFCNGSLSVRRGEGIGKILAGKFC